jgi:hypothetical protein
LYDYELVDNEKRLSYLLDNQTKYQFTALFPYVDDVGKEYLTFLNNANHEILFYDLLNENFLFRIKIEMEGPNGIIAPDGYFIENLNSIYVTTPVVPILYTINQEGEITQKINYGMTESNYSIVPFASWSFFYTPLFIINNKLYITQKPTRMAPISATPVSIVIDTVNNSFKELPFLYPPLIKDEEMRTHSVGFGLAFSRDFTGEIFIYSFYFDEEIYVASIDHKEVKKMKVKSKYIDKVTVERINRNNMLAGAKQDYETPQYGNLLYDKYRNVYYRLAYPKVELENGINYLQLTSQGRKKFSIIILDKEFNIIGETLFPEYAYNSSALFVHKDGLYICNNHPMNSSFKEDILSFSCFELRKQ